MKRRLLLTAAASLAALAGAQAAIPAPHPRP